jgi:aarF domain-containing kinase
MLMILPRLLRGVLFVRQLQVYYTAVYVFLSIQWARRVSRKYPLPEDQDEARWDKVHAANAARVFAVACRLRGFWVKVGQYLSSRGDVMPGPWVKELSKLQDTMPFQAVADVLLTLQEELHRPVDEIFSEFSKTPLASASIAQVCAGVVELSNRGASLSRSVPPYLKDW